MKEPTYSLIEYVSIFRCLWPFSNRKERNNSNKLHHINSIRIKHFSLAQSSSQERMKDQISMQIMPKVKLQEFCWYVNKHRDGNEKNIYTSAYKFIIRTILTSMEWNCTVNGNKDAVFYYLWCYGAIFSDEIIQSFKIYVRNGLAKILRVSDDFKVWSSKKWRDNWSWKFMLLGGLN